MCKKMRFTVQINKYLPYSRRAFLTMQIILDTLKEEAESSSGGGGVTSSCGRIILRFLDCHQQQHHPKKCSLTVLPIIYKSLVLINFVLRLHFISNHDSFFHINKEYPVPKLGRFTTSSLSRQCVSLIIWCYASQRIE